MHKHHKTKIKLKRGIDIKDFLIWVVSFSCRPKAWRFGFPDFWVSILGKLPDFWVSILGKFPDFLGVTFLVKMAHQSVLWVEVTPPPKNMCTTLIQALLQKIEQICEILLIS